MTDEWPPEVIERQRVAAAARERIRASDPVLFERFSAAFFHADPAGINLETNTDEYEPEVATLIPRMPSASTTDDVAQLIREELTAWFGPHMWNESRVEPLAVELWSAWQVRPAR